MTSPPGGCRASVVIPAYNEGRVLGRCLRSLLSADVPLDIVVAANGCTDDTVEVARSFDGVRVVEVPQASKVAALNAGDQAAAAQSQPRIYLDADIRLDDGVLVKMVEALTTDEPRVAAPRVRFATEGASWGVRRFYDAYVEVPYVTQGMVGLGIYGLSAAGRRRFGAFPALRADDLFIQQLFTPAERILVNGEFEVQVPRDLANLVKVRTRVAGGNAELAQSQDGEGYGGTLDSTVRALGRVAVRRPPMLPAVLVYVGVILEARRRARRRVAVWHRDDSTR